MAIWEKITTVTTPTWTSVSEITTPSTDGINHWNNTTGQWELYSYEWGKLVF